MPELTNEQMEEFRIIFDECDQDNNGAIDWDEFCCMADKLLGNLSLEEKSVAFHLVDTNHSGRIDFNEFIEWWSKT